MPVVLLEKLKVLAGQLLNFPREQVETLPELRRCSMHLKISQFPLLLGGKGFFVQEFQLASGSVALDLPIPALPISFGHPFPQSSEVLGREGRDLDLQCFNLRHVCTTNSSLEDNYIPFIQLSGPESVKWNASGDAVGASNSACAHRQRNSPHYGRV